MSNYGGRKDENQGYYAGDGWGTSGADYSYSFPATQPQQSFESFDYGRSTPNPPSQPQPFYNPNISSPYASSTPSYFVPQPVPLDTKDGATAFDGNGFEDEPPLLEELGINPYHIMEKTYSVLNPLRSTDATILQDTDLAGPVVFCVMFGFILLLTGKVHFGYIYGIGVTGCVAMYFLLNMMSVAGVSLGVTISVLGYCLLPMVGLAGVNILLSLQGIVGTFLTLLAVLWCSLSASKLFVTALAMQQQQTLVAYPCALLYGVFALLAVF